MSYLNISSLNIALMMSRYFLDANYSPIPLRVPVVISTLLYPIIGGWDKIEAGSSVLRLVWRLRGYCSDVEEAETEDGEDTGRVGAGGARHWTLPPKILLLWTPGPGREVWCQLFTLRSSQAETISSSVSWPGPAKVSSWA